MTHSKDEEETRHVFRVLDSTIDVIGVDRDFNDSRYKWNMVNSFVEN